MCTAVGNYTNSAGVQVTLAEAWNGTSWTIQATPNPTGARDVFLSGVSCTAVSACMAVGDYTDSAGVQVALAERWSGGVWAIRPIPNPTGAQGSFLAGVSCVSAGACTAVGGYTNSAFAQVTLAERWNGTGWAVQATPHAAGAFSSALSGVSCPSASACTAVGDYSNTAGDQLTLAERWNGTSWAVQATPNPAGGFSNTLLGVSCTSASACTAVGSYINNAGTVEPTLAERWNGSSWAIQTTANPAGATDSLGGVSCATPSACAAVGNYYNTAGIQVTLAEGWNGKTWVIQTTVNPTGAFTSVLSGVSCTAAGACTAVGYTFNKAGTRVTLAERWTGTGRSIQATPNPTGASSSVLLGVSCTSATACTAVGYDFNSAGKQVTLAEHWNGSVWAIQTTPNPSGAQRSQLTGVSCPMATACAAVGDYTNSSGTKVTVAEDRNGAGWAIQPTPTPAGTFASALSAVSCTAATACTAVGNSVKSAGQVTLAERWNGTTWAIQATPNPAGGVSNVLSAVSCTSATACTAVGNYTNSAFAQVTLAERWAGKTWAIQATPNPAGGSSPHISGLSCTPPTACAAVGSYTNSAGRVLTLAEAWNGTSWAIQPTPNQTGASSSVLSGVSCTTATTCAAAGGFFGGDTTATLAESYA